MWTAIIWFLAPVLWAASSLLGCFVPLFTISVAYRYYKTIYSRRWHRPISGEEAILITGATSGIGLALAKHLYSIGYSVIATYYDSKEAGFGELTKLGKERERSVRSQRRGQKLFLIELNVRSEESIGRAGAECRSLLKEHKLRLYGLVNNAGVGALHPFSWIDRRLLRSVIETNLMGTLLVTRELLPLLIETRGRVLNVSSGLGFAPGANYIAYGITKQALLFLSKAMNQEIERRYGVKTIAVIPHNFIKSTNIVTQVVRNIETSWEQLGEEERRLYRDEYEEHQKLSRGLEATIRECRQQESAAKSPPAGQSTKAAPANQRPLIAATNQLVGILRAIKEILSGKQHASSLEGSGTLEVFEDALRLPSPCELMFAGDFNYSLLVGAFLVILPTAWVDAIGASVSPSLYR